MAVPQQESIYMYLASVDCVQLFSDNNPASFRSKLPQPLYFENPSEWELGLKTYIGPVLHANMEEDSSRFFIIHHQNEYSSNKDLPVVEEIKLPDIYYHSITHLVDTINNECRNRNRSVTLRVENDTVSVTVEEANCGIFFKTYMARILGFKDAVFVFSNFTILSDQHCFVRNALTTPTTQPPTQSPPPPPSDLENAYADYEETDPKVAEEILARRKGTTPGNVYDDDDEVQPPQILRTIVANSGVNKQPKHSSSFLTHYNVANCLTLLANAPSHPFNIVFKEELGILNKGDKSQPIFEIDDGQSHETTTTRGKGKFHFQNNDNFNHSAVRSASLNFQEHCLFFNLYANSGGIAVRADFKSQLSTRLPLFWVYLDCIIDQITGNGASPVLRTIPLNNVNSGGSGLENSKISVINFDDPIYVELNKRFIDVISCDICTENGNPAKFPQGSRTLLVLHLRKRQRLVYSL